MQKVSNSRIGQATPKLPASASPQPPAPPRHSGSVVGLNAGCASRWKPPPGWSCACWVGRTVRAEIVNGPIVVPEFHRSLDHGTSWGHRNGAAYWGSNTHVTFKPKICSPITSGRTIKLPLVRKRTCGVRMVQHNAKQRDPFEEQSWERWLALKLWECIPRLGAME